VLAVGSALGATAPAAGGDVLPPVRTPTVSVELPPGAPDVPRLPPVAGVEVPVRVVKRPAATAPSGHASTGIGAAERARRAAPRSAPSAAPAGAQPSARSGAGAGGARAAATRTAGRAPARAASRSGARHARAEGHRAAPHRSTSEGVLGALPLLLPVPDWSKPIILGLLLIVLWLGLRSRLAARRARRLDAQRAALARDLDVLQSTLVPELPERVGRLTVSAAYRPADGPAGGGDFYDVVELDAGRVAIVVGDASGHGRAALARAVLTRYTLRAYVEAGLGPRSALQLGGKVLAGDGEEFTTVVIAVHDPARRTLTYSSAGHPPPLVRDSASPGSPATWTSPPIGWGVPTGRAQTTVFLGSGARACFYSDGLTEARSEGAMLGREGLDDVLGRLGPSPSAAAVLEAVRARADASPDDMAVCIVEAGAGHATPASEQEIEVDGEQLTSPRMHHFLRTCRVPRTEIGRALAAARPVVAEHGTALLQLRFDESGVTIAVARPDATAGPQLAVPRVGEAGAVALARIATGVAD
jgi:hypothetical protein